MHMDIMTGEIKVDFSLVVYCLVRSSSSRGGDRVKGLMEDIVFLACYKFHFIRVHDNLSNNKSIFKVDVL